MRQRVSPYGQILPCRNKSHSRHHTQTCTPTHDMGIISQEEGNENMKGNHQHIDRAWQLDLTLLNSQNGKGIPNRFLCLTF